MQIHTSQLEFQSGDGKTPVYAKVWEPERPRYLFQIVHGMVEYVDRYDEFAKFMCEQGALVFGNDHLGHGHTGEAMGVYGFFAKKDGEQIVMKDLHTLTGMLRQEHPDLPVLLFGHSMGSLLARAYSAVWGSELSGAIYSGTSGANPLTGLIRLMAGIGILFGRRKKPAPLLSHLAFSRYNDQIENVRTANDWLTRDTAVVDRYNQDPWTTFQFTDGAAYDMANLVDSVSGVKWAELLPKDIGYLLISGDMDPVGNYGKGVEEVYDWMIEAGLRDVTMTLYPGARHELTNEINRDEIYQDIAKWTKGHVPE